MITTITSTKNHAQYLENYIENIIFNKESPIEKLVICNDGSEDETKTILEKFINCPRIRIFHNEISNGSAKSINAMLSHVETPFIHTMSTDDVFFPAQMSQLFKKMKENNSKLGFGKYKILIEDNYHDFQHHGWNIRANQSEFISLFSSDIYIFLGVSIIDYAHFRSNITKRGLFDLTINQLVQDDNLGECRALDWDLVLHLSSIDKNKFEFLNEYCGAFRKVHSQLSSKEIYSDTGRAAFEMALLILKYFSNYKIRRELTENQDSISKIKNLLILKISQTSNEHKVSTQFIDIYQPILKTALYLLQTFGER